MELEISYNSAVVSTIPTDPPTRAESGAKWLLVRMDVTNAGATERTLTAHQYILEADGDTYEYVATDATWAIGGPEHTSGPTVAPIETATGWVVFHIPMESASARLTVRENTREAFAISFTRDASLATSIPENEP